MDDVSVWEAHDGDIGAWWRAAGVLPVVRSEMTSTLSLDAKLEVFDGHAKAAVDELILWLSEGRADLIALARGRHVEGHYRYGDVGLFEHGHRELQAEAAQEVADAIVYLARRRHLLGL